MLVLFACVARAIVCASVMLTHLSFPSCWQCLTIAQRERYQKLDAETRVENILCGIVLVLVVAGIIVFFIMLLYGRIAGAGSGNS